MYYVYIAKNYMTDGDERIKKNYYRLCYGSHILMNTTNDETYNIHTYIYYNISFNKACILSIQQIKKYNLNVLFKKE